MDILLVEDNPAEILLAQEGLKEIGFKGDMNVLKDGQAAIDFLSKLKKDFAKRRPDLILLDLNLPKRSGLEVLQFIKGTTNLKEIPTIVLSTSTSQHDMAICYSFQANSYMVKPMEFSKFTQMLASIIDYWSLNSKLSMA